MAVTLRPGFAAGKSRKGSAKVRIGAHPVEPYYLRNYPDVAEALANGLFGDAHHHYVEFGYFEDRLPFGVEVDTAFYYREYPDIEAEVDAGTILTAQDHFEHHGYKEGRLPRANWSLLAG
jgi:hypothetical protein